MSGALRMRILIPLNIMAPLEVDLDASARISSDREAWATSVTPAVVVGMYSPCSKGP
jgi:hypothetical protein